MTTLIPKYDQGSTGAVNRPINIKLQDWVHVKDFGAIGDGTADDTTAIQNALNASSAVYFGGPGNTYKITAALTVNSGQVIFGEFATVQQTTNNTQMFNIGTQSNITITGINAVGVGTDFIDSDSSLAVGVYTTGPGAIVTGTVGAIGGAVSGLLEAGAEDLGFGAGTQFLAGMVTPGAGLSTKVGQMIEKKAAENTARFAGMAAKQLTGIPGIGTVVKKGAEFLESKKPVNVGAIEDVLGIEGKAAKVAQTAEEKSVEATAMRQNIASRFEKTTGAKIPEGTDAEKYIYNEAASAINKAEEPFVGSSFFNRAATIEGKVNPAQAGKYKKLFQDADGNPLPGADVLTKLRDFKYGTDLSSKTTPAARDLRWEEGSKLEKEFNGWLMKQPGSKGQPWEAHARGAFEQVAMNKAKDALPSLFEDVVKAEGTTELKAAAGALERQVWNLSKTPEGQSMFLTQLTGNLKNIPAKEARVLWNRIGPEVEKRIVTDPKKFKQISDVMNSAETPQDINRAVRLINGIITAGAIAGMRNL